ncbi:P-loop containing nucleoside triphosphate hydrolase protein [Hysterangium stoloniferum]|nr:P-loop containing nucleoside triphosphate hydrolase protein [Hysterangium stoloniferum]
MRTNKSPLFFRRHFKAVNCSATNKEKAEPINGSMDTKVAFEETKAPAVSLWQLFRFSTRLELALNFLGLVCAVGAGAAQYQPLMALIFGNLTNEFVAFSKVTASANFTISDPDFISAANNFKTAAAKDAVKLTYIGIALFNTTYLYMLIWVHTGEAMAKRIREKYLRAILRQDIAFFDNVGAGEVATRIQTDTHLFQQGTSEKVPLTISAIGAFVCGFVIGYMTSWRLALALTAVVPCIVISGGAMGKFMGTYVQTAIAESGSIAEEAISTVRTAKAFGSEEKIAAIYDIHARKAFVADSKTAVVHGIGMGAFIFSLWGAYALAFSFGATLIIRNRADAGDIATVLIAIIVGSFSLAIIAPEVQAIINALGAAAKLWETIDRVPSIDSASKDGLKLESVNGVVEFEDVNFSYPSRPDVPIVTGLNITFEAGKKSALVGASGSGKSTIVSLVERFYDPLSGIVKLDGHDLKSLNVKWLRSQIGLVSQEPTLFATTITGNVVHGLIGSKWENAPDDEKMQLVKEACIKANADVFIEKLPSGYDTMVGERGFLLSGGQKQRIAIARAIISDPRILLLDEATSALDTQSEEIVQNALDKAAAGRTTISIAHRLSTIKDADTIFVMGEGLVLQHGTHTELLANPDSPYAKLVQAQRLKETVETPVQGDEGMDEKVTKDEAVFKQNIEDIPVALGRQNTGLQSIASEILDKRRKNAKLAERRLSLFTLFIRMGKLSRETWSRYAIGTILAILNGMVFPSVAIVYGGAVSTLGETDHHRLRVNIDRVALWFFIIALLAAAVLAGQTYLFSYSAARLTSKLRSLSFRAILRQDIAFSDEDTNSAGSLTAGLSENPQKISGLAGITLGTIIQNITCLVGGSIIGVVYTWKVALIGIACCPLIILTGFVRLRVVVLKDQANKKAHETSAQVACEAAAAIKTVASLTREDDCLALYSQSLEVPLRESNRTAVYTNGLYASTQALSFFVISLVFWFGSRLIADLEINIKSFYVCIMAVVFGSIQVGNVVALVPDISSAQGAANDVINLLDSVPTIDSESEDGQTPQNVSGHVRLEDVHFRYPTRPGVRVLRGLNLEVKPGTYIALVGASGCGKSTVIQLLERFYDPLAGRIYLDGQLITDLNIREYRKQISLVSQEPTLYAGTVRFNILLGAIKPPEEVTQEEIEAACRAANILEFIQFLPNGFETEVGGKGSQLSGGQKQRIAIARALLRNPKVLLLDEATSALDSNSEKVVQAALDEAAKGRTTIAIAHRLSTIQNANRIYFIKEGRVSESGTHDQLISLRGGYYEYVQLQDLSKN